MGTERLEITAVKETTAVIRKLLLCVMIRTRTGADPFLAQKSSTSAPTVKHLCAPGAPSDALTTLRSIAEGVDPGKFENDIFKQKYV